MPADAEEQNEKEPTVVNERLQKWLFLTISSMLVLWSLANHIPAEERTNANKTSLAMSGLAMCIGVLSIVKHKAPPGAIRRVSNEMWIEFEGSFISVTFICSAIALFLNLSDNIDAVYYFSWIAFSAAIFLIS
mmetsp:Transcript_18842/g.23375  ORF Transcript_18842/g.23375 Transcript_18842/m.23375 type:complete len:133 (+) Transcript_18842:58-456(+)